MDGIRHLFQEFSPQNFWDTDNKKELDTSSWEGSPYDAEDWKFYKNLRDSNPQSDPNVLPISQARAGNTGTLMTQASRETGCTYWLQQRGW